MISQLPFIDKRMAGRKLWTPEEDEIISDLIQQHGTSQWTIIAKAMNALIPNSRSSKQIRQRWYNHLSPVITKAPWKPQQNTALFEAHARIGNKWKDIAGELPGRTDNAVKNHFYSTIRRALRRMDKHFGYKDSTRKMRTLKPSALTYFLQIAQEGTLYSEMMELILEFAEWKPTRQNKKNFKEATSHTYDHILQIISEYEPERKARVASSSLLRQNESTQSDRVSLQGEKQEQQEAQNYFGGAEFKSWFSMDQRELILQGGLVELGQVDGQQ